MTWSMKVWGSQARLRQFRQACDAKHTMNGRQHINLFFSHLFYIGIPYNNLFTFIVC